MENPVFRQTASTRTVTIGQRSFRNHNKLLWQVEGADGVKTGYTKAAGRILVSSATRDGRRLVAVTINAPDDWTDHAQLLNSGFSEFEIRQILTEGDCMGTVEIIGGDDSHAQLLAAEDFSYPLAAGEKVTYAHTGTGFVYAPVVEGAEAGEIWVLVDGKAVKKIPVRYGATIEREPEEELSFWAQIFRGD